jgi:hypothetical protein
MIIGEVGLAELTPVLRHAEQRLYRSVNPTLYTREEFATKLHTGHHFLKAVLDGEKLFILGDPHELAAIAYSPPGAATHAKPPLVAAQKRFFCSSKRCLSPSGLPATTLLIGAPTSGI